MHIVIQGDESVLHRFAEFCQQRDAPSQPCQCHGGPDLFAPSPGNEAAEPTSLDEAMEQVIADEWADEAADLADLIADAIQPGDANYTLLTKLTRKLQAHIRRA